jgi:hypothetical protein
MDQSHSMEPGEGEGRGGSTSLTSGPKRSRKKDSPSITLGDRLIILQQSIVDYQAAGGRVELVVLHGNDGEESAMQKVAIVLHGTALDLHGNLVLL